MAAPATELARDLDDGSDLTEQEITQMLELAEAGTVKLDAQGNVVEHLVLSEGNGTLVKRQDGVPNTCLFYAPDANSWDYKYRYYANIADIYPNKRGDFCFGWDNRMIGDCTSLWGGLAKQRIVNSMRKQLKKDGLFTGSDAGGWTAGFIPYTTAFADPDIRPFRRAINAYWGDGNYIRRSQTFVSDFVPRFAHRAFSLTATITQYYGRNSAGSSGPNLADSRHAGSGCP